MFPYYCFLIILLTIASLTSGTKNRLNNIGFCLLLIIMFGNRVFTDGRKLYDE